MQSRAMQSARSRRDKEIHFNMPQPDYFWVHLVSSGYVSQVFKIRPSEHKLTTVEDLEIFLNTHENSPVKNQMGQLGTRTRKIETFIESKLVVPDVEFDKSEKFLRLNTDWSTQAYRDAMETIRRGRRDFPSLTTLLPKDIALRGISKQFPHVDNPHLFVCVTG